MRDEPRLRLCNRTMDDVYQKTQQKMEQLRAKGYRIEKMWECEWDQLKQTRSDVQAYVASLQFVEPLNPRDAFCGRRTNATKLYHHVTPEDPLHRLLLLVPLGQQDVRLPQRSSPVHLATGLHQHQQLLWFCQIPSPTPARTVPSCVASPSCR